MVSVVVGGHSAQGRHFDVVEVVSLGRDAQVVCVDEAASVGVHGLVVGVDVGSICVFKFKTVIVTNIYKMCY